MTPDCEGYDKLVPWLSKFDGLSFPEQQQLAGNGQCLGLFGPLLILAMVSADIDPKFALKEAAAIAESHGALSDA